VEQPSPLFGGVEGRIIIHGSHFGSTAGLLAFCKYGTTPYCTLPPDATPIGGQGFVILIYSFNSWTDSLIDANVTLPTNAIGLWQVMVYSVPILGGAYINPSRGILTVGACAPTVRITSRPITIYPSGTPGRYLATLTSTATPPGGSYTWSSSNPSMVGFSPDTPSSGPNATQVTLVILSTNDNATITLTYVSPCGAAATDSFTFALTNDTTVLGWVDGAPINLPQLEANLTSSYLPIVLSNFASCVVTLLDWKTQGYDSVAQPVGRNSNGLSDAERQYANGFLIKKSANTAPSPTISSSTAAKNAGNYRVYQRLQASYEVSAAGRIDASSVHYLQQDTGIQRWQVISSTNSTKAALDLTGRR
jgi:hypothetical protein